MSKRTIYSQQSGRDSTRSRLLYSLHNHPMAIPVVVFLIFFFTSIVFFILQGGRTMGASDSRVVHISINGDPKTIPTRAATVGELLRRLDIKLHEKDIIEPAKETVITEDNFSINIYKARPVLVIDGARKVTTVTAEPTLEKVAEAAGMAVYPEDKIESRSELIEPSEILQEGIVAEKIVIDRATPAHINLYGKGFSVRTHSVTVAEVLKEKNIIPRKDDVITPALGTALTPGVQIFVTRVGSQIDTREEEIPMPVEVEKNANALVGSKVIRQTGSPGRKLVTYEIQLQNGKEVGRRVIQEVVAEEPVKQIEVVGTKVIYSNPSSNVALGQQIAAEMGWGHEFDCIYQIFQRESRWNHTAYNRYSGAYGIPQALPGSKMASVGSDWETNPATQIRWGIGYMVGRYGSPCAANDFWNLNKWY